eukprot:SAG31_NODE_8917_length_1363_cov_3.837025_1_plen_262_part_10
MAPCHIVKDVCSDTDVIGRRLAQLGSHIGHRSTERSDTLPAWSAPQAQLQSSATDELSARGFVPVSNDLVKKALCELQEQGYTILPDVMSRSQLELLRQQFEHLSAKEGRLGGIEVLPPARQKQLLAERAAEGPNPGIRRLGNLVCARGSILAMRTLSVSVSVSLSFCLSVSLSLCLCLCLCLSVSLSLCLSVSLSLSLSLSLPLSVCLPACLSLSVSLSLSLSVSVSVSVSLCVSLCLCLSVSVCLCLSLSLSLFLSLSVS